MRRTFPGFLVLTLLHCNGAMAQAKFFTAWEQRVRTTYNQQPAWPVPVVTASSGLTQLARFDVVRQYTSTHTTTWNFGNSKGFNLIPWYKTELDINLPPYIVHNSPRSKDGAGDVSFLLKYRPFAGNAQHHNYAVSVAVAATAPTGSYKNGSPAGTVSPTVYLGKGFGNLAIQSSLGAALPTGHTQTMGRPVTWNASFQYQVGKLFWPEVEFNSTFYHGGPNDGRIQSFATPGVMVSKFKFVHDPQNRLALLLGVGEQIAISQYHSYNHGLAFTGRITF
jgi:hypothetical protein